MPGYIGRAAYLDIYTETEPYINDPDWTNQEALVFAGRMVHRLSGDKLGAFLISTAYRLDRTNSLATYYYYLIALRRSKNTLSLLLKMQAFDIEAFEDPSLRADWLALTSQFYSDLRDFWLGKLYAVIERHKEARVLVRKADMGKETSRAFVLGYIDHLGNDRERVPLKAFVNRVGFKVVDTELWGVVGHALSECLNREHMKWFKDYRKRDHLEQWMLTTFLVTCMREQELKQAHQVMEHALSLDADQVGGDADLVARQETILSIVCFGLVRTRQRQERGNKDELYFVAVHGWISFVVNGTGRAAVRSLQDQGHR